MAFSLGEPAELIARLHALGDYFKIECVREFQNRMNDSDVRFAVRQAPREAPIDFYRIDRKFFRWESEE